VMEQPPESASRAQAWERMNSFQWKSVSWWWNTSGGVKTGARKP
jgi:hypothetical protein